MTTYEAWSIGISGGALVVAAIAVIWSIINRGDSKRSADQARRSADISERSFILGLKPALVVTLAQKRQIAPMRPQGRDANALYLESKGSGIAFDIRAELHVCSGGNEFPFGFPLLALRPGQSHEVRGVPWTGELEVWGKVVYRDAENTPYCTEKARGEGDWHWVEQPE
jgi:hypothetical protein